MKLIGCIIGAALMGVAIYIMWHFVPIEWSRAIPSPTSRAETFLASDLHAQWRAANAVSLSNWLSLLVITLMALTLRGMAKDRKENRQNLEWSQRAWLCVEKEVNVHYVREEDAVRFYVNVTNTGQTPAHNTTCRIAIAVPPDEFPDEAFFLRELEGCWSSYGVVPPKGNRHSHPTNAIELNSAAWLDHPKYKWKPEIRSEMEGWTWEQWLDGHMRYMFADRLFLFGEYTYETSGGHKARTRFAYKLNPMNIDGRMNSVVYWEFNDMT